MKAPAGRVVRAALRCLIEDLGQEVGPDELRRAVSTAKRDMAADARYLFPVALAAAEHIVLDKANMLAADPRAEREPIDVITDRAMVKVKSSDRRGALWQDDEGTWWLLAAGRRKNDGPGDFYREIERFGSNSDPIAPTEDDYRYLRYERAYIADCEAEREAQVRVVRALLDAAAVPGSASSVEVFGAVITIVVESEGDDGSEMLNMAFDFTSFEERGRFPVDVTGFVPGTNRSTTGTSSRRCDPEIPSAGSPTSARHGSSGCRPQSSSTSSSRKAAPRRRQRHPSMANWRIGLQPPW